ncbi:MAG: AAA family ATPase, partial [Caldilineaceae bacterium]|nr:AAA family ATPase [Caldilineaceae bacterium]
NPAEGRHWHLLRLYACGPAATFPGSVADPLVTALRTPGRARLLLGAHETDLLDDEGRVSVATRADFVGRRRALQSCLRALRPDSDRLGVILYGLGGNGKSTLAHRLRQRWRQQSERHGAVVLYGRLDEALLLRKLGDALRNPAAREALQGRDNLRYRLREALEAADEQLLIILDNFEDNFEQAQGAPHLVDGQPRLTPTAVALLDDLSFALQASSDFGQEHRLLLTSRYRPQWRDAARCYARQLERLSADAVQKKVRRLTTGPRGAPSPRLHDRAVTIADGNPRLLEWLFALLNEPAAATPDLDGLLARMAAVETQLRANILAATLLAAQPPALRQLLARGCICELPVPAAVFDALAALAPALPETTTDRQRAVALGLLETTPLAGFQWSVDSDRSSALHQLRVPRILEPLLVGEEQPAAAMLAATAARELYAAWWAADGANPNEAQQLEIHRLALAGGEGAIAEEIAQSLVRVWNRPDQYRYREVIALATDTVRGANNALLLHELGYASDALGEKAQ